MQASEHVPSWLWGVSPPPVSGCGRIFFRAESLRQIRVMESHFLTLKRRAGGRKGRRAGQGKRFLNHCCHVWQVLLLLTPDFMRVVTDGDVMLSICGARPGPPITAPGSLAPRTGPWSAHSLCPALTRNRWCLPVFQGQACVTQRWRRKCRLHKFTQPLLMVPIYVPGSCPAHQNPSLPQHVK